MSKFYGFSFLFLAIVALNGCGTNPHPLAPVAAPSNASADTQAANDRVMAQLFGQDRIIGSHGPHTFFDHALRSSQEKLAAKDIQGAKASVQDAQSVLESSREYFSNEDYQRMQGQINAQLTRIAASE